MTPSGPTDPADNMDSQEELDQLREHISRSVADQLLRDSPIDWAALTRLDKPVLRIQVSLLQDEAAPIASVSSIVFQPILSPSSYY